MKDDCGVVFFHASSVSLQFSFSWIIHITRTLKRVAALQRKLLKFLITTDHCPIFILQITIIWEAWIWSLPPPLVDDASCRETKKTESKDARCAETPALAVMECLNFRERHVLVLPRFVVHLFLDVFGDVLCFGLVFTVPMASSQVFDFFIHQRCLMDRERCNLGIIWKF